MVCCYGAPSRQWRIFRSNSLVMCCPCCALLVMIYHNLGFNENITLMLLCISHIFLAFVDVECLNYDGFRVLSINPTLITSDLTVKKSLSPFVEFSISCKIFRLNWFWSVSSFITNFVNTPSKIKCLLKMECIEPLLIFTRLHLVNHLVIWACLWAIRGHLGNR